ncbi:zinc-binding dehydrogenase [Pontixanthobacter aestiaquae]|uniref:NADH oxidase n=1 Tax=Pontixanthobacter aestiaquae TaxID=1509367 RepID=A0A844Z6A5_9SPHN|nr:zinc-binding dehydrogenase [Pontixanthobacter aestiaquae]MDN3645973.1 zinc-binding dehydrogenase [Pontixanthobacter aestiaquae]MXO83034.1 NADH oxidase [Pontixanthobacter aestiaquae]
MTTTSKQIFSTLDADGTLTVEVGEATIADPKGTQVLVKMEAAPINPSDLALLFSAADLENAEYSTGKIVAQMPEPFLSGAKGRHGQKAVVGNEGAGTVVATGDDPMAQALMGQRVACVPGNAFGEYCIADAPMCLPLGDISSVEGASAFVNPMTALGFVETAKMEGHNAIIHLAAASNLGQMLNRICQEDDMKLVNIVRKQEQVDLLKSQGAEYVVNSSDDDFMAQLRSAIDATDAYLGFDPIGGGKMVDACLKAMEQVASSKMTEFSRYGSNQDKKMYQYGRLDLGPTILTPSYGLQWHVAGWLLTPFLAKAGMETVIRMRTRVLQNMKTTFASNYKAHVNLEQMLEKDAAIDYRAMRTGEKYLVTPHS